MLAADFGFAAVVALVAVVAFLGPGFFFVALAVVFLGAVAFLGAAVFVAFFAAAGFLAAVAGLGAAGSFLASFTVPEGPVDNVSASW